MTKKTGEAGYNEKAVIFTTKQLLVKTGELLVA